MCWREPAALAGWQRTAGHMCSCSHPAIKGGGSNAAGASGGCKRYNDVLKYIYIYSRGRKKEKKEGLATRTFWGFACAQTGGRVLPRGRWKEKCIEGWVYCIYLR